MHVTLITDPKGLKTDVVTAWFREITDVQLTIGRSAIGADYSTLPLIQTGTETVRGLDNIREFITKEKRRRDIARANTLAIAERARQALIEKYTISRKKLN